MKRTFERYYWELKSLFNQAAFELRHNLKLYIICLGIIILQVLIDVIASYAADIGKQTYFTSKPSYKFDRRSSRVHNTHSLLLSAYNYHLPF
jgi:hypothetical protein